MPKQKKGEEATEYDKERENGVPGVSGRDVRGKAKSLFSVKRCILASREEVTELTFSAAAGCENKARPRKTRPAAAHRVHGLDHARSRGHAARVLLQAVRLLVDCFHLDVRLPQCDPAPTWKQNTGRLRVAAGMQCLS